MTVTAGHAPAWNTADPTGTVVVAPALPAGAWMRMVTGTDLTRKGGYALRGQPLDPSIAYRLPAGAIVITCARSDSTREISMLRVTESALEPVKTWQQKAPIGPRIVKYIAARLIEDAALHRADRLESAPNRYPGRCARCRRQVPAGDGLVAPGSRAVTHAPGQCPPPPAVIDPNRYANTCFNCGNWVAAGEGVAIRLDRPDESTGSWYRPAHRCPCPADGVPGPANRVTDWCADCGEVARPGTGYWFLDLLHHRGPCPDPTVAAPTWALPIRSWTGRVHAGQVLRLQVDLRHGGPPVPSDAPGLRILTPTYVEFVAVVVEAVTRDSGRQKARIRVATAAEAVDILAAETGDALMARPHPSGFRARLAIERVRAMPGEARLRIILGLPPHAAPWLAEIVGRDPDYRWERRFLHADRDWRQARRNGVGVVYYWTLICNRVYQVQYRAERGKTVRAYLRATADGDVVEISAREVQAWLNSAPVWPAS